MQITKQTFKYRFCFKFPFSEHNLSKLMCETVNIPIINLEKHIQTKYKYKKLAKTRCNIS